jgi:hypothetical protein
MADLAMSANPSQARRPELRLGMDVSKANKPDVTPGPATGKCSHPFTERLTVVMVSTLCIRPGLSPSERHCTAHQNVRQDRKQFALPYREVILKSVMNCL